MARVGQMAERDNVGKHLIFFFLVNFELLIFRKMNPPMSATHRSRSSNQWHATMSAIWLQCRPYATAGRQCRPYGAAQRVGQGAPQHCGSAIGRRFAIVAKQEASSGSSASRPCATRRVECRQVVHMSASRPYVGTSSICRQVVHMSASRPTSHTRCSCA